MVKKFMNINYSSIDALLSSEEPSPKLVISKGNFESNGFISRVFEGSWERPGIKFSRHGRNILDSIRKVGSVDEEDKSSYKKGKYNWYLEKANLRENYTFLERLLRDKKYLLIFEKQNGYIRTSIVKPEYTVTGPENKNLFSIMGKTFQESFEHLNYMLRKENAFFSSVLELNKGP